jgi:hypothetical protein
MERTPEELDAVAFVRRLHAVMEEYMQTHPHPLDWLSVCGTEMTGLFMTVSRRMHLLNDDIEALMETTFDDIRTATWDAMRLNDTRE